MDSASSSEPAAGDDEGSRFFGLLKYAKDLTFSEETFMKAVKLVDCRVDANNLLKAMLDVNARNEHPQDAKRASTSSLLAPSDKDSSSSCYSSLALLDTASSTDQSLESLPSLSSQLSLNCLRNVYVDGCNIAKSHGKDVLFSWPGIKICTDWFLSRKHKVKVYLPADRCDRATDDSASQLVLTYLIVQDALVKTPTGSNDDLFIIEAARQNDGVIVSNDQFRDEKRFKGDLESFINMNRLPYVFDDDLFIPASDPRGRTGPTLDQFLKHQPPSSRLVSRNHTKEFKSRSYQQRHHQRNSQSLKICRFSQPPNNQNPNQKLNSSQHRSLQLPRTVVRDQTNHTRLFSNPGHDQSHANNQLRPQQTSPLITFEDQCQESSPTQGFHDKCRRQQFQRAISLGHPVKEIKDRHVDGLESDQLDQCALDGKHLALCKTNNLHNVQ